MPLSLLSEARAAEPGPDCLPALQHRDGLAWLEFEKWATPLVHAFCHKRRLQEADADSIAHQVLLAVVEHLDSFSPDGQPYCFRRWLLRIAAHKVADLGRRQPLSLMDPDGLDRLPDPHDASPAPRRSLALDPAQYRSALDLVRPEFHASSWRAFELTALDGWTAVQAGADLGMRPGAVRVAKSRVLRRVREVLDQGKARPSTVSGQFLA